MNPTYTVWYQLTCCWGYGAGVKFPAVAERSFKRQWPATLYMWWQTIFDERPSVKYWIEVS